MDELILREAQFNDFEAIADLCNQLGYQTESEDIPLRLKQIHDLRHHSVFVAELDRLVIGWIHVYLCPLLVSPLQAQLGGLVVHTNQRGKGVGEKLVQQAEAWSKSHACQYLTIYTNVTRTETHKFYNNLGYKNIKTEHVLRKEI
jgi:GNAT superfamily N-acetyltransferase